MSIELLRSQKNQIFTAIQQAGLNPVEFGWTESESKTALGVVPTLTLTHMQSGFWFAFSKNAITHATQVQYFPSTESATVTLSGTASWESTLEAFRTWIRVVHREFTEPDLWEVSKSEKRLMAQDIDEIDNSPFSLAEQSRIAGAINELRLFLLEHHAVDQSRRDFIESRLNHLESASTRLGRKDWITLAMGTLTNIVVGVALAPDAAKELFRSAGALLGWVVGNVNLIP